MVPYFVHAECISIADGENEELGLDMRAPSPGLPGVMQP